RPGAQRVIGKARRDARLADGALRADGQLDLDDALAEAAPREQRFVDVLEVAVHVDAQRRVARERAEAARHVGELLAGRQADDLAQQPVARALGPWHPAGQLAVRTEARAERPVGRAGDEWRDAQSNVGLRELPV